MPSASTNFTLSVHLTRCAVCCSRPA